MVTAQKIKRFGWKLSLFYCHKDGSDAGSLLGLQLYRGAAPPPPNRHVPQ